MQAKGNLRWSYDNLYVRTYLKGCSSLVSKPYGNCLIPKAAMMNPTRKVFLLFVIRGVPTFVFSVIKYVVLSSNIVFHLA